MTDLTAQQAMIFTLAKRGHAARAIADAVGCSPAQVADQIKLIHKKGYEVKLLSAVEARRAALSRPEGAEDE